ncbi:uncharacterized protein N7529_000509 [Penicillium soppii]|uniref:uncharacterized protein n=1 Tax=Penicillium soppii TaxID=69789 RepID=UPI00254756C4|nr:uncharacterized protein N7529_000509 [Penicillium soppii]KAJ5881837.1 hypothetical protein N7529_000509 [Penicillium soppii]
MCILVHSNEIVDRGMNGMRHAEFIVIAQMLESYPRSALQETDLYVTIEPRIMCASALEQCQIRIVYYGCANDRFGGIGRGRGLFLYIRIARLILLSGY